MDYWRRAERGQRTNSSIFRGRKTSGACLSKGGKWQFSVFKGEDVTMERAELASLRIVGMMLFAQNVGNKNINLFTRDKIIQTYVG